MLREFLLDLHESVDEVTLKSYFPLCVYEFHVDGVENSLKVENVLHVL